jgi:hypothetical protein
MKRRVRWSHAVITLGVIAALAIAAPSFGLGKSIKKAIRKEVSKQIAKATGPAGPAGTNGANGTARAYALVIGNAAGSTDTVDESRSKNITDANVTHPFTGTWCFNGLPFTPINAFGNSNAQNRVVAMQGIDGDAAVCAGDEQAQVIENVGNTGAFDNQSFFIVFN